jgi:hypothetical protein
MNWKYAFFLTHGTRMQEWRDYPYREGCIVLKKGGILLANPSVPKFVCPTCRL